jgi:hypothetical protein
MQQYIKVELPRCDRNSLSHGLKPTFSPSLWLLALNPIEARDAALLQVASPELNLRPHVSWLPAFAVHQEIHIIIMS